MPELPFPTVKIIDSAEKMWGTSLQPVGCENCGQAFLVDPARMGQICPNCFKENLITQPTRLRAEPPELLIPFRTKPSDIKAILTNFVKGVWLRPDDFNTESLFQRAIPLFWPMWLVDSDVTGDWQAEIGYDYQVESSQDSYTNGRWRTHKVVETRVRWEPRLGQINRHYDNIVVPALTGHHEIRKLVGTYQRDLAQPYSTSQVQKTAIRIPDLQPENAWPLAQTNLNKSAGEECRQAAGGQHVRNFAIHANYTSLNWTQLLLPMYATYYSDEEGQPHPIYINGQTGAIGGLRLASQRKGWMWAGILAAIALILFVLGVLGFVIGAIIPPMVVLGTLFIIAAFASALAAIVPAVWPWQWNRKQKDRKVIQH